MSGRLSKQWATERIGSSRLLERGAATEPDLHTAAGMYEMAAHNSSGIALSDSPPRLRAIAKQMAVRQYLHAIKDFVDFGDFFRADSNFQGLMDLYPRLRRSTKDDLDDFVEQWKTARREDTVPNVDLSTFKHALRE